eukprot:UN02356
MKQIFSDGKRQIGTNYKKWFFHRHTFDFKCHHSTRKYEPDEWVLFGIRLITLVFLSYINKNTGAPIKINQHTEQIT